jgi:hypothetical protein
MSTWEANLCTVCAHWTCTGCGFDRPTADRRYPQQCPRCYSVAGEFTPVRHQRKETAVEHAGRISPPEWEPVDSDWFQGVIRLAGTVQRPVQDAVYHARLSKELKTQTPEHVENRNAMLKALRDLETAVRAWVADHPEKGVAT